MAEGQRITTPAGSTGLTRFYDVSSSHIQLDPKLIVGFAAILIVVEIMLQVLVR